MSCDKLNKSVIVSRCKASWYSFLFSKPNTSILFSLFSIGHWRLTAGAQQLNTYPLFTILVDLMILQRKVARDQHERACKLVCIVTRFHPNPRSSFTSKFHAGRRVSHIIKDQDLVRSHGEILQDPPHQPLPTGCPRAICHENHRCRAEGLYREVP